MEKKSEYTITIRHKDIEITSTVTSRSLWATDEEREQSINKIDAECEAILEVVEDVNAATRSMLAEMSNGVGDFGKSEKKLTVTSIGNCARCGGDHQDLEIHPLSNSTYSHFAMCPTLQQPILIRVEQ